MTIKNNKKIGKMTLATILTVLIMALALSGCIGQRADEGIIVPVNRDSASGTREFFYEFVMNKEDFTNMIEKNSNKAVHQTVSQTEGAIGYVGLGYIDNKVKALKINGVEPTVANVMTGTYPISRNLNMYTNGEPTGAVLEFLNYLDSDEGQAIVAEEGFVPKQGTGPYAKVEGLSGEVKISGSTTVLPIAGLALEEFKKIYPNVIITVSGGGSSVGITDVGNDNVHIGMASREIKSSEKQQYPGLVGHVVCSDGIAIIVHPKNDYLNDLTVQQIKDIYLGTYTNWKEL